MPYPLDHKAKTRAKIVASARGLFNRRGYEQVTIDEIMASAGLTRGAFYHHFTNKEALFAEAVASIADCSPFSREATRRGVVDHAERAHLLVDLYLADEMLKNVDEQCPLYALPSDVARSNPAVRAEYTTVLERMIRVLGAGSASTRGLRVRGSTDAEVEGRAFAAIALCVGAMVVARTTQDASIARRVRVSARAAAHEILAGPQGAAPRAKRSRGAA
jgi:AcrR family transcriptional regulator